MRKQKTAVAERCYVYGVVARGSWSYRLEQANKELFAGVSAREHAVMFKCEEEKGGNKHKQQCCPKHYAGVKSEVFVTELFVPDVPPYDVTRTAHNNERAYGEVDDCVAAVRRERGEGIAAYAHKVKARVAERRNAVEEGKPYSHACTEVLTEPCRKQHRARKFDGERENQNAFYEHHNSRFGERTCRLRHYCAFEKSYSSAQCKRKQRDERHKSYAADLYEQQYENLSEPVPVRESVVDNESRHAGSGR